VKRFPDRAEAGRALAFRLDRFANRPDVIVLGLPRGGIPVAAEVARALHAELDVFSVRKLGVPGQKELAMGAIASGGVQVLNRDLIQQLGIPPAAVQQMAMRERLKLERQDRVFRDDRPPVDVGHRIAIVVDDGLATGATMQAAVAALTRLGPSAIVVAAPVGAPETCERLARMATEVVVIERPDWFNAVGEWYEDFSQTTDNEVIRLLADATPPPARSR
jgi:putative phosphoribosyl transferase